MGFCSGTLVSVLAASAKPLTQSSPTDVFYAKTLDCQIVSFKRTCVIFREDYKSQLIVLLIVRF